MPKYGKYIEVDFCDKCEQILLDKDKPYECDCGIKMCDECCDKYDYSFHECVCGAVCHRRGSLDGYRHGCREFHSRV